MRINKFIAASTGLSRRAADTAVDSGRAYINGAPAQTGQDVGSEDTVTLDGTQLHAPTATQTILLHKPAGYVVSRDGQGGKTVYDLLPRRLHHLKPVGRLDKDSSGLLLLTNNGQLTQELTHPSRQKVKVYEVTLNSPLSQAALERLAAGVPLEDGPSKLNVHTTRTAASYRVLMHEGRNRQIRRTFTALGYDVKKLHRVEFGPYVLQTLPPGQWTTLPD